VKLPRVLLNGTAVSGEKGLVARTARARTAAGLLPTIRSRPTGVSEADCTVWCGKDAAKEDMRAALGNAPAEYKSLRRCGFGNYRSCSLRGCISLVDRREIADGWGVLGALFGDKNMIDPDPECFRHEVGLSHGRIIVARR